MDNCGVAETNDPRVRILWEREGRTVRLGVAVEPESSASSFSLPPGCATPEE